MKRKKIFSRKPESGRSMIEMVGVLAVTGLITAAAYVLIRTGMSSEKMNSLADEIDILVSNVRVVVAGGNTCSLPATSEIGTSSTNNGGAEFARALLKTTSAATRFGGSSYYAVTRSDDSKCSGSSKTDRGFKIHLVNMPSTVCTTINGLSYAGGTAVCLSNDTTVTITYSE